MTAMSQHHLFYLVVMKGYTPPTKRLAAPSKGILPIDHNIGARHHDLTSSRMADHA
jgi:hypothetical protein